MTTTELTKGVIETFYLISLPIKKLSVEEKTALCPIINSDWVECDEQLDRWNSGLYIGHWDALNQLTCSDYKNCPHYQSIIKRRQETE